jgi:hypothetical protein
MPSEYPKTIYRYQQFSALSLDALCNDKLYFSKPSAFNDPLDCKPSVVPDSDKKILRHILEALTERRFEQEILVSLKAAKIAEERGIDHAKKQARHEAEYAIKNIAYHATNPEYEISEEEAERRLLTSAIESELLTQNNRGICCFSATYDNPLLWSHYAAQHHGFCIGYSLERKPKPEINKVLYGGSRTIKTSLIAQAILDNDVDAQKNLDQNILLRKAAPWKYEKE